MTICTLVNLRSGVVADPPSFEDIYDEETLRARDEAPAQRRTASGVAHRTAATALTTALLTGVKDAVDPDDSEPVIEEVDPGLGSGPPLPVTLLWVQGDPAATIAVVRPWLF